MTKLNDTQIQVLTAVEFQGNVSDVTVHPSTLKALKSRGLIAENGTITTEGRKAIGVENPHASIEAEVEEEYTDHPFGEPLSPFEANQINNPPTVVEESGAEIELTESDEAPVPFFNRKARREFNRNIARYNRRLMRLYGKRVREYGPENVIIRFIAA